MPEQEVIFKIGANTTGVDAAAKQVEQLAAALSKFGGKTKFDLLGGKAQTSAQYAQSQARAAMETKNLATAEARLIDARAKITAATARQINAETKLQTARARSLKAARIDIGALGDTAERMASRFNFLLTAAVSGFAFDVVQNAANEFVKLEGQLRGLEIASARAGVAGRKMFDDLTTGASGFRFKAQDAADAINKLIVGGLKPTQAEVGKAGQVAAGASILFGEDPSKMLNDLATAALRTSYRLADNLGIVIRANETYDKYAASIGKTRQELTAVEKAQAFWNAMVNSSSAKVLAAAGQLDTLQMKFQTSRTVMNQFFLALGENIAKSIIPMADALNKAGTDAIDTAAQFTVLTAKSAMIAAGLGMAARAMEAFSAATTQARLAMITKGAAITAITAIIAAAMYAYDQWQNKIFQANQLMTDAAQRVIMYQQTMAGLGFAAETAAQQHNALLTALNSIGANSQVIDYFQRFSGAIDSVKAGLDSMLENAEKVSPQLAKTVENYQKALDELKKKLLEAAETSKSSSEAMAKAQKLAGDEMADTMKQYETAIQSAMATQANELDAGLNPWQEFSRQAGGALVTLVESCISNGKMMANALAAAGAAAGSAVAATVASFSNQIVDFLNSAINAINKFLGALQRMKVPKLGVSMGPMGIPQVTATGMWHPFGNISPVQNITGGAGAGGGLSKEGWKANYAAAWQELGGAGYADAAGSWFAKTYAVGPVRKNYDLWWTQQGQPTKRNEALKNNISALMEQLGFDASLLDTGAPAGKGKKGGGGGGGGKGKAPKNLMAEAVKKLEEQLMEIELQNQQLREIYPTMTKQRELEEEKLAKKQDEMLLDFEITGKKEKWYDALSKQQPEIVKQVEEAKIRTRLGEDLEKAYQEALTKARENIEQAKRENEIRRSLGEKVDEAKIGQDNLNEAIKLASEHGKTLAEAMGALGISAQDTKGYFDQLKQEARDALTKAQGLRLDWDLSQLDYQNQLAAAREGDPNRRTGIGFNGVMQQFQRQLEEVARTEPASEAAVELAQTLQKLQIEAEQTATSMREDKILRTSGAEVVQQNLTQMAADLQAAISQLNPEGYIDRQVALAEQQVAALESNTGATGANTSALYALTTTMGGVAGQIAGAISGALSQVNAAIAAAQQAAAPAITAALQGTTATTGGVAAGATGGGGGGGD